MLQKNRPGSVDEILANVLLSGDGEVEKSSLLLPRPYGHLCCGCWGDLSEARVTHLSLVRSTAVRGRMAEGGTTTATGIISDIKVGYTKDSSERGGENSIQFGKHINTKNA